ncbi:MAG: hypothetical protein NT148_01405 [Candidatus Nealsonbacteria bacterium]|nr:hypothetical protein [Candidatus Nealsonbacteria bacterium]
MSIVSDSEVDIFKRFGKKLVYPTFLTIAEWNAAIGRYVDDHKIDSILFNLKVPIRYYEETIVELLNTCKWLFIFDPGFSIRKIHTIIGTDRGKPHFSKRNTWWLEEEWAFTESAPAFYLVSKPTFRNQQWDKQEEMIKLMGENFRRASMRVAVNAGVTGLLLYSKKVPLGGLQHWSSESGNVIGKIFFDFNEFSFASWPRDCFGGELGACVKRIFDF